MGVDVAVGVSIAILDGLGVRVPVADAATGENADVPEAARLGDGNRVAAPVGVGSAGEGASVGDIV